MTDKEHQAEAAAPPKPASPPLIRPSRLLTNLAYLALALIGFLLIQHPRLLASPLPLKMSASPPPPSTKPAGLRIGSFNLRYDGRAAQPVPLPPGSGPPPPPSGRPTKGTAWGERPWAERRWKVVDQVVWEDLDVVGFQEALTNQVEDLSALLGEDYGWVGVGRDDGKKAGEYVPIFYKHSTFKLLSVEHIWLSETPSMPGSKSWDMGQTRMATLAHLQLASPPSADPKQKSIYVLNTHWDDRGVQSRFEAAGVILAKLAALRDQGHLIVLVGDLNSPAREGGYQRLTGGRYAVPTSESIQANGPTFLDSAKELARARVGSGGSGLYANYGERNTYTGFSPNDRADVIDVVLALDNGAVCKGAKADGSVGWRVRRAGVLPNAFDDGAGGAMSSDHRVVVAGFEWAG